MDIYDFDDALWIGLTSEGNRRFAALKTEGRKALIADGREEHGPYQSPSEDGMIHFHEFVRRHVEPAL